MQSRTSFFNAAVFRKNLTRFAPAWAIYTAGCMLVILNLIDAGKPSMRAEFLGNSLTLMAVANLGYAIVCALLLWGDLFNARLCNALHAMPLRREGWFVTNLISALTFCMIPYTVVAAFTLPMLGYMWYIAPLWLAGSVLQFLVFFSLAVLSIFCTGNRFAAGLFYALLNFLSLLASWFVETIYDPLLEGVIIRTDWCTKLCPVMYIIDDGDWMSWFDKQSRFYHGIGSSWVHLLVLAGLSLAVCALALVLYRSRKLECAGDFVVVRLVRPIFLVVYTLAMAAAFQLFDSLFIGSSTVSIFFAVGLAIGWFTGLMLLKRTVRIFRGKTFLGFAVLAAVLFVSILLVWSDPLGLTRWVPSADQVQAVKLDTHGHYYQGISITQEEEIREITDIHTIAIEENQEVTMVYDEPYDGPRLSLTLRYYLKDGTSAERTFLLDVYGESAQRLIPYLSDPQAILGYENWDKFLSQLYQIRIDYNDDLLITGEDAASLAQAIRRDCEEGNMVQLWQYHDNDKAIIGIDIVAGDRNIDFAVYADCIHTMHWLKEHGLLPEYVKDAT